MTSATIADIIDYEAGRNFTDGDRDEAVKRLFATGMFSNARVTVSGSTLVVQVWENSIINQVVFRGNRKQKDDRLKAVVESQPRGAFDQATLDGDVEAIIESYSRIGRNDVTVSTEVVDLGEGRVNVVFQIQEGGRSKIAEINIVGNNAFSDRRLYSVLSTKRSNPLSWLTRNDIYDDQRLAADEERLRRFYFNHGYADFRILSSEGSIDPNTGNVVISITIDEGERYAFGNIEIDSTISGVSAEDLRSTVAVRTGATYSAKDVEKSLIAMSERLAEAGFPFAEVTPIGDRNFATGSIDVRFVVDQGQRAFIERIEIVGNTRSRDYIIRREFDLAEGDAFNQIMLRRAQKRLEALDFFETVNITTRPGSAPDRVVIVVNAVDKSTGEFGIGAGYTTDTTGSGGVTFEASISERNFLGRGQALRVGAGGSQDSRTFNISFTEPYFLGYRLAVTTRGYRRTTDYTGYDVATTGGSVGIGLPITEELSANVSYQFSVEETDITNAATAPQAIQDEVGPSGSSSWTKSAVVYGVTFNSIDDTQDPHSGVYLRGQQEVAGLGGDAKHLSSTFSGRYYKTLSDEADLVGSVRVGGGHITGLGQDVRTVDHFRIGPSQIRGFAQNGIGPTQGLGTGIGEQIGGKTYFHASAEAQFPLPALPEDLGLKGAVFADTATLFGHDNVDAVNTDMAWRASAGVSLIWHSPFAPIRFDYAIPFAKEDSDEEQRFNFTVSTAF